MFSSSSSPVCIGSTATLEVKECMFPSKIRWSVTPNLDITYEDGYSVEVKANSNGEATITATFENGQTYTKKFWVGVPKLNPIIECDTREDCWSLCKSYNFGLDNSITVNTVGELNQNVREWEWEKLTTNFSWYTDNNTAYFQTPQAGFITFRVRAKNDCGDSEWQIMQIYVRDCGNNSNLKLFKIYPNPTSYLLNIELENPKNALFIQKTEIGIYNLMGQLKKSIKLTDFKGQIYVNDLPKGLYILKINIDGQLETHQIQID